jgi:AcrR family transcriptional regulator
MKNYHHGDLREALLKAALAALGEVGLEQLSLRGVARRAGVTTGAPYHHFADKEALVAALATQGFERLERSLRRALTHAGSSPARRLEAVCRAYLTFATKHADVYTLMFSAALSRASPQSTLLAASLRPFALLAGAVEARTGRKHPQDPLLLWSLGHGLAQLANAGLLGRAAALAAVDRFVILLTRPTQ